MSKKHTDRIMIGTAQFGMDYGITNQRGIIPLEEIFEILKLLQLENIKFLDTAPGYGKSEEILGDFSSHFQNHFQITSKLSPCFPEKILENMNSSLFRLKRSNIYGYLVHHFPEENLLSVIWNKLCELRKNKVVKKIGFSLYYPQQWQLLIKQNIIPDIIQIPLSVFDQRFLCLLTEINKLGTEIHTRSIFLQGAVFIEPNHLPSHLIDLKDKLEQLKRLSLNQDLSIMSICLGFVLSKLEVDKVIIGIDSLDNLKDILQSLHKINNLNHIQSDLNKLSVINEKIILPFNWR